MTSLGTSILRVLFDLEAKKRLISSIHCCREHTEPLEVPLKTSAAISLIPVGGYLSRNGQQHAQPISLLTLPYILMKLFLFLLTFETVTGLIQIVNHHPSMTTAA